MILRVSKIIGTAPYLMFNLPSADASKFQKTSLPLFLFLPLRVIYHPIDIHVKIILMHGSHTGG